MRYAFPPYACFEVLQGTFQFLLAELCHNSTSQFLLFLWRKRWCGQVGPQGFLLGLEFND